MELVKSVNEVKENKTELHNFRDIKPETDITPKEAREYWDKKFSDMEAENNPAQEASKEKSENTPTQEVSKEKLEQTVYELIEDLKDKSEVPDTISDKPFDASNLEKTPPELNAKMHEEFYKEKQNLIKQWEAENERPWPTYKEDVWIKNKEGEPVLIRQAGAKYDVHHIQPLCLGGKNEVGNITPLSADVHFDHKGVHGPESPYAELNKMLGGNEQ